MHLLLLVRYANNSPHTFLEVSDVTQMTDDDDRFLHIMWMTLSTLFEDEIAKNSYSIMAFHFFDDLMKF